MVPNNMSANLTELKSLALDAAENAVVITDRDGRILWHNPAFTRLTGYTADDTVGRKINLLRSGKHGKAFYRTMWQTILSGRTWQGELINRRKDGSFYLEEQTITPVKGPDGEVTHFIAIKGDITERKQQQEKREYLATHDPLTNLPNRRALEEALDRAIARTSRGIPSVLVFVDVDNLKMINDSLGHTAGDQALKGLAHRLKSNIRAGDLLARMAGDEFVILLEGTDISEASQVAERIRESVYGVPILLEDEPVYMTVSIGLASVTPCESGEELLARADAAMYEAKQRGGNRFQLADETTPYLSRMKASFLSGQRVRKALEDGRILFEYEPIVRLEDGRIEAYEALLRLRDEDGDILRPAHFLRAAERGGFMNEIDRWVITDARRVLNEHPDLILHVNLSGCSFNDEGLMGWLVQQLTDMGETAHRLKIEMTETAIIHDLGLAMGWLKRLHPLIGGIVLDDFGTGFSSFAYLRHLAVDALKIDKGLIRGITDTTHHQTIVRAIRVLAQGLNVQTIAEGVENEGTANLLRELGVTHAQGYVFSKGLWAPETGVKISQLNPSSAEHDEHSRRNALNGRMKADHFLSP